MPGRDSFKELSKNDSNTKVRELLKSRIKLHNKHFVPGNIVFTTYSAKDKTMMYDRTPLALILRRGSMYSLVLNFHWLPVNLRVKLIQAILKMNRSNIEKGKPLEFNYLHLKPMLKSLGYAPCIRKYINARIGTVGVVIPPDRLMEVARMKAESFTSGRYSARDLYKMARNSGISKAKRRASLAR